MNRIKTNILAISVLLSLAMSAAAGQPDFRFDGIWVGAETYQVYRHGGPGYHPWGSAPVQKTAEIGIGDFGKILAVGQGLGLGRYEISPSGGGNTLTFKVIKRPRSPLYGRTWGRFALSADGNTLTETGFALVPGRTFAVTCNISGTFHRKGTK
jgi:hypothetical protein